MFPRVRYQCQLMGCWSSVYLCLAPELKSRSDQKMWASDYPHWSFSAKLLTPKGGSSFIVEILTNRSHQVNLRSLLIPCFAFVVYNETWWPMFNVHLGYKPPSSWRKLFRYGGYPRQFSRLKKIRSLLVPGGGFCKGTILPGGQQKRSFHLIGQSCLRKKGV